MLKWLSRFFIFFLFLWISILGWSASDLLVKVSVDKNKVKTGEVFTYRINLESKKRIKDIILPKFDGFKVISQNREQRYLFGKGGLKIKLRFTFKLIAYNPGIYTIDKVKIKVGNKVFESDSVTIEVRGSSIKEAPQEKESLFEGAVTI